MKPFVRVVGVLFALGCEKSPPIMNPPKPQTPPDGPEVVPPVRDPALPTWDSVVSGHPEGATNPPYPVLLVAEDTRACFKEWRGGMMPPAPGVSESGGQSYDHESEVQGGTKVQCPEGQPDTLIAAWAAWEKGPK